jgi:Protein of unknown function (DUF3182)
MPGTVVLYAAPDAEPALIHQETAHTAIARALADLKGFGFGGYYTPAQEYSPPLYVVTQDTIVGTALARSLNIVTENDLFGGVVPYGFVKTKAITHPLVSANAERPVGWQEDFTLAIRDAVLPGYTAFSSRDAHTAAERLSDDGRVRVKQALAAGGHGQWVISATHELEAILTEVGPDELTEYGIVLERNLEEVQTLSVGLLTVNGLTLAYHGQQRDTADNEGQSVYGGSDLAFVRGGHDALLALGLPGDLDLAVRQAKVYDRATRCYPGILASRRNYDVAAGRDDRGRWRVGVLEQSWRIGGATGAEIAALREFTRDPSVVMVAASTVERFGPLPDPPPEAEVHFSGMDPQAGPVTRYATVRGVHRVAI